MWLKLKCGKKILGITTKYFKLCNDNNYILSILQDSHVNDDVIMTTTTGGNFGSALDSAGLTNLE